MVRHSIGSNETVQYFNSTVNGISLHSCLTNFVMNSHVEDPGQPILVIVEW